MNLLITPTDYLCFIPLAFRRQKYFCVRSISISFIITITASILRCNVWYGTSLTTRRTHSPLPSPSKKHFRPLLILDMTVVVQMANLVWKLASMLVDFEFVFMPFLVKNRTRKSSSETPFKLLRFTMRLSHLEKSPCAQATTHIYSFCKCQITDIWAKRPQGQISKFLKPNKLYTSRSIILGWSLFSKRLYLEK